MITTTYLEITDPRALRPAGEPGDGVTIERVQDPAVNRALYERIGARWSWTDRLAWDDEQWAAWARRVETWVLRVRGAPAGYVELDPQPGGEVELAIFGLLDPFHGRGLGGQLLTFALRRAWALHPDGTRRVWVHTCTLDGPSALANYEARGLTVYRRESGVAKPPAS